MVVPRSPSQKLLPSGFVLPAGTADVSASFPIEGPVLAHRAFLFGAVCPASDPIVASCFTGFKAPNTTYSAMRQVAEPFLPHRAIAFCVLIRPDAPKSM